MTEQEIKQKVLEFATKAHEGQTRWDKKTPYIIHPIAVAEIAMGFERIYSQHDKLILYIVCMLHDTIEDTSITIEDIKKFLQSLKLDTIDIDNILHSLIRITKQESESYLYFVLRAKSSYFSKYAKIADITHNLSDLKKGAMRDKYELALYLLKEGTFMAPKMQK